MSDVYSPFHKDQKLSIAYHIGTNYALAQYFSGKLLHIAYEVQRVA